jgi:hypothetical protein
MSSRAVRVFFVVVALVAGALAAGSLNLAAAGTAIPSAIPGKTPGINTGVGSGQVYALAKFGDTVVVGGNFTQANDYGSTVAQNRSYILAFDANTGAIKSTFAPVLNGMVNSMTKGPTDNTVIIGGSFTKVNGVTKSRVATLNVADGSLVSTFNQGPAINGMVNSVGRSGNRLYVGGLFTTAGGVPHVGLTVLDATTGAIDNTFMNVQLSQRHNDSGSGAQGTVGVKELDVAPDGNHVVVIGNFKKAADNTTATPYARDQVMLLNTGGSTAVVSPTWATTRYTPYCFNWAYDSYVRDVAFSPDGSYFVVGSSGGYTTGTLCDTVARFETNTASTTAQPTWVNYTGGDTIWGVTVTDSTVFVHNRWLNNISGHDNAAQGAVPRPGIAALDTQTGVPLDWNPGRNPRGESAYVFLATDNGVYFGSDTEYIGNFLYKRPRLGFFPYAGGHVEATDSTATLPANIQIGAPGSAGTSNTLSSRSFDGTTAGTPTTVDSGASGITWSNTRGAFWAGSNLYYGYNDGFMYKRSYNGNTFGPAVKVDPYHDPYWDGVDTGSGNTYDGAVPGIYGTPMNNITGMTYSNGKLFYSSSTSATLFYRAFNTDSGIVGSEQITANTAVNWKNTSGLFVANGYLYWANKTTGALWRAPLVNGLPSGAGTQVATGDFRGRSMFLAPITSNAAPTASISSSCSDLSCSFDGSGSSDSDGSIASYSWNFGDGSPTATGATVSHDYTTAGPGTYTVTLTVTDNQGATSTTTKDVTVSAPTTSGISYVASNGNAANSTTPSVNVPAGVADQDTLVLYGSFASAAPAATDPAGWTRIGEKNNGAMDSVVWTKTASASDSGAPAKVTINGTMKWTMTVADYRGAGALTATNLAANAESATSTNHVSPTVTATPGSWLLSYWADKSGTTTNWTEPASVTNRKEIAGSPASSGRVTSLFGDSNAGVPSGTAGGLTATTDLASKGVSWSIVLPSAG